MRSYQANIYHLYSIKLSKWLMLIMPIVALFYTENGLDHFDIFLLQAIYSTSVAVMEIPSGYMADVIDRKKSLVIGSILGTLGYLCYSLSHDFSTFLVAEIILGLGGSFISGSDSALLYDSLAAMRQQQRYLQFEGRITSLGNFAETAAAIGGGLIAGYISYRAVYVAQIAIAAVAIPASILLLEPPREKLGTRPGLRQILAICHHALLGNGKLASTILLSSVIGTGTLCMAWTSQVFFVHNTLTELSITPLWVVLNLTAALVAAYASKVYHALGKRLSLLVIIVYIPCGYILLGALPLIPALLALLLFYGVRGYATPVLKDLINENCSSSVRATVLSIRSMVIRISFSCLGPLIGVVSGKYDLGYALMATGGLLLCSTLVTGSLLFWKMPQLRKGKGQSLADDSTPANGR